MGKDSPGVDNTETFLGYFTKWFNSNGIENPSEGMMQFFREFRPQDDITDRMKKMWYVKKP